MRYLWQRSTPYITLVMMLYALAVALVLLVTGWVAPWWLVSAGVVWSVAVVVYTAWKMHQRRHRQWQRRQDRQLSE